MSGARLRLPLVLALVAASACLRDEPLRLVGHDAGPDDGARLNQPIVLTFSVPIDPGSVRAASVRVVRARDGGAVEGGLAVEAARVTFTPRTACRPDLSDGAFLPGERYRVEVPGLPQLACVRSLDGALLEAGVAFDFATVAAPLDAKTEALFVDANPGVRPHFEPSAQLVDGRARIRFSKPLDPRTIPDAKFYFHGPWSPKPNDTSTDPLLRGRLVENGPEAVIELSIVAPLPLPLDAMTKYEVFVDQGRLRDISGEPLTKDKSYPWVTLYFVPTVTREKKDNP